MSWKSYHCYVGVRFKVLTYLLYFVTRHKTWGQLLPIILIQRQDKLKHKNMTNVKTNIETLAHLVEQILDAGNVGHLIYFSSINRQSQSVTDSLFYFYHPPGNDRKNIFVIIFITTETNNVNGLAGLFTGKTFDALYFRRLVSSRQRCPFLFESGLTWRDRWSGPALSRQVAHSADWCVVHHSNCFQRRL